MPFKHTRYSFVPKLCVCQYWDVGRPEPWNTAPGYAHHSQCLMVKPLFPQMPRMIAGLTPAEMAECIP